MRTRVATRAVRAAGVLSALVTAAGCASAVPVSSIPPGSTAPASSTPGGLAPAGSVPPGSGAVTTGPASGQATGSASGEAGAGVSSGPAQAAASCHLRGGLLPDPVCTPGVSDPAVTEANIGATICIRGYTAKVRAARAPYSYTRVVKRDRMAAYGYAGRPYSEFELDHLIPLELGGDPHAVGNLWVEFNDRRSGNSKDALENRMNALVCAGRLSLAQARAEIAGDWVAAYRRYVG